MAERTYRLSIPTQNQVEVLAWIGITESDRLEDEAIERYLAERAP